MHADPPIGFGIRFFVDDDKSVFVTVTFDESKEGGRGILHGGAIAAVLDEAMGTAAYEAGSPGYTATMTYDYKSHIPLHTEIRISAWVNQVEGKKVYTACEARLPDSQIAVSGTGLFIKSDSLKKMLDANPYTPKSKE